MVVIAQCAEHCLCAESFLCPLCLLDRRAVLCGAFYWNSLMEMFWIFPVQNDSHYPCVPSASEELNV